MYKDKVQEIKDWFADKMDAFLSQKSEEFYIDLNEANSLIRDLMSALHALPCSSRDFLGDDLWMRVNRHLYGVDNPYEEVDNEAEEEFGELES